MAKRSIGRTPEGAVIYFGTKAEMDAITDILDATAQFWLSDGSRYRANGIGGWDWTHAPGGVPLVADFGTAISSYNALKATTTAPAAGTASEAIPTGAKVLDAKNLSTVTAEYCIVGFGINATDAETNRDAGGEIIRANVSEPLIRIPANATHIAWKSASGTPSLKLGYRA